MHRHAACAALLLALACGPGNPGSDGSASDASTSDASTSDASTGGPDPPPVPGDLPACFDTPTSSAGDTGDTTGPDGDPLACPPLADQPCTAAIDCASEPCGSHISAFDAHGCPRRPCTNDSVCDPGEACLFDSEIDAALPAITCTGTPGACECNKAADIVPGVCVPEAQLPDNLGTHCDSLTSAAACSRFDVPDTRYCRWYATSLSCGQECAPSGSSAACIAFTKVGDGCIGASCVDGPRGYARLRPGGSELFSGPPCGDEPVGWVQCISGDEAPACCVCGQD